MAEQKIASFNINNVNRRLQNLADWPLAWGAIQTDAG